MASHNRDQWGRPHSLTQPQRTQSTDTTYAWSRPVLTPSQSIRSTRPHQPTVEDVADESRTHHQVSPVSNFPHPHPQLQFPNSNIAYSSFGDYDYPANLNMSARRSTHPFVPPSLCSDSSTFSSASSNFSVQTPTFDQQCRRRSSQQAFLEWEGQEALARANKRMATAMPAASPFFRRSTDYGSDWVQNEALYPPNGIRHSFRQQFSGASEDQNMHVTHMPLMQEAFSNDLFQSEFSPLQQQSKQARSAVKVHPRTHILHQDVRTQQAATFSSSVRSGSPSSPKHPNLSTPPASSQVSGNFQTFLESELHRRSIADKTIHSIRSTQARAVAQTKENTRRTDWAKEVLLKFPIESAMCESLNPGSMMRAVAADGVFEMTSGLVR